LVREEIEEIYRGSGKWTEVARGDGELGVATRKPQMPGSKSLLWLYGDDISWTTPQRGGGKTRQDRIQRLGMAPQLRNGQNFSPELLLSKGNPGTKNGAETEGKAIQRLPHLGIHPTCRHWTRTNFWCQEVLADRSLIQLSPEKLCQILTNTNVDACATNHQTEHKDLNGGVRGRTEGAERALCDINGTGGPWSYKGLMPWCRGMLGWWDGSWGRGKHPHRTKLRGDKDRGLAEGKLGKGITFEM
jgi:hypothetical protein